MSLEKSVENWVDYLHDHSRILTKIIDFLRKTGISGTIRKKWVYLSFQRDVKNPTKEMIDARRYFKENKELIKQNIKLLEDDLSKDVYRRIIQFRYSHDTHIFPDYSCADQYFPKDIVQMGAQEVFVDCGAYQGDTYEKLKQVTNNKFKRIVCIEPAEENYDILKRKTANDDRVCLVKAGVWSKNTELLLDSDEGKTAKITNEVKDDNCYKIIVRSIDTIPDCESATFIKMDVEGAEISALKGAENVIRKNHPKLAISIYHSNEDLVQIIQWVAALNMGYKMYVRQHDFVDVDTVLYAI